MSKTYLSAFPTKPVSFTKQLAALLMITIFKFREYYFTNTIKKKKINT